MRKSSISGFSQHHFSKRNGAGFTLIELLVVIAIIGILSSIVLASLNTARQKSRDARRVSDVKQLQLALELYYDAKGAYPTYANFFGSDPNDSLKGANYISIIPSDPGSATACTDGSQASCYKYSALLTGTGTTCTSYHLGGSLEVLGNSALASDNDAATGSQCTSPGNGGTDFAGLASGACGTGAGSVATDLCYDVKP